MNSGETWKDMYKVCFYEDWYYIY